MCEESECSRTSKLVFGGSTSTQNMWKHGYNPVILHGIIIPSSSSDTVI